MVAKFETTPLAAGTKLEGYVIDRVLARGPYGYLYLARDAARQACMVREFLPHEFATRGADGVAIARDPDDRTPLRFWLRAFLEKAVQVSKLTQSGLPPVLAQFEANGTGYVISAYQPGQTLQGLLEQEGTLGENPLRRILLGVLTALEAAHKAGFQHRDVRPDNIWVREDGQGVELLNFGVLRGPVRMKSRLVTSEAAAPYAAPEESNPTSVFGPGVDLYALGAIAYRALTGVLPPDAMSRANNDTLAPTAEATRVRVSENFAQAIDWALNLAPERRPLAVIDWRESLRGSGSVDVGQGSGPTAKKSKPKGGLIAAVVVLAVVAGGGYVLMSSAPKNTVSASPAPAADSSETATGEAASSAGKAATNEAEPSSLDRLALEFMSRDKKAQEAQRQREQADQEAREARAREQAARSAAPPPAPAPAAPVAAAPTPPAENAEAIAKQKALEKEVERLRTEAEARKRNEEAAAQEKARAEAAARDAAKQSAAKEAEALKQRQAQAIASARKNCQLPAMELSEAGNLTFYNALSIPGAKSLPTGVIRLPPVDLDDGTKAVFEITPDSCAHRVR